MAVLRGVRVPPSSHHIFLTVRLQPRRKNRSRVRDRVIAMLWGRMSRPAAGAVTADTIRDFFLGLPAVLAGTWLGMKLYGRLDEKAFGGWLVVQLAGGGLSGLALVAAIGLAIYGGSLAIVFRTRVWQEEPKQPSTHTKQNAT